MLLEITHETVFDYSEPVSESYMEFRLTPLTDSSQHLLQHHQRVLPAAPVRQYVDGWGNTVSYFNLISPSERIQASFDSIVETFPTAIRGHHLAGESPDAPPARAALFDFLQPTRLTFRSEELQEFVRPMERLRDAPVGEAAERIRETIYSGFRYEGGVTDASSPITEVLRQRAGVCQDFAHLMLATCRCLGFAARYVSGYILVNADEAESHAWVEVFDAERGWLGADPTHNEWVAERHVRVGIGRDYRDVAPNRGLFRGQAEEKVDVTVRIRPIDQEELETRARTLYAPTRAAGARARGSRKPAPVASLQQLASAQQQQQQEQ